MNLSTLPVLSALIFLPALGGLVVLLAGEGRDSFVRRFALAVALVETVFAALVFFSFDGGSAATFALSERIAWIPLIGAEYSVGVDGVSAALIALTALLTLLALIASWDAMLGRARAYAGTLLFLTTGVVGAFAARDLLLFFVFWEFMLIPAYLFVGICGGPNRMRAALKFFVYTTFGSLLMLVGLLSLSFYHAAQTGVATFDLTALASTILPAEVGIWLFAAFALAFAIKTPIFPLHTWIGDLYAEAPIPSMLLITMLTKVGAYGFLRLNLPLFPQASAMLAPYLVALGVVGVLYGGLIAWRQRDIVRLMAYSSVAQLGFIVVGIFALDAGGATGAVAHMVNHGISAGAIFFVAAIVVARVGTTDLDKLGGLAGKYPILAGFFLVALFSAAGLPGLNGFVGEFLILLGAFRFSPLLAAAATLGVVVSAIYLLSMYRRAMNGPAATDVASASGPDVTRRELLVLVPLVALIVAIGVYPAPLLDRIEPGARAMAMSAGTARARITTTSACDAGLLAAPIPSDSPDAEEVSAAPASSSPAGKGLGDGEATGAENDSNLWTRVSSLWTEGALALANPTDGGTR